MKQGLGTAFKYLLKQLSNYIDVIHTESRNILLCLLSNLFLNVKVSPIHVGN